MTWPGTDPSWLPDHQLHVVATLAHVDDIVERAARLIADYTEAGPLMLGETVRGDRTDVIVRGIAPLPAMIPRLVADALTQLRAALEHSLYSEIEHLLGRPLAGPEERCIEVPATVTPEAFDRWLADRRRRTLPPLDAAGPLAGRLRMLQPFQQEDTETHPLRLLAEHTNLVKHRMPAIATTRLGAVYPDQPHPGIEVAAPLEPGTRRSIAMEPGDILASAPRGERAYLNIVPTVALQRPHTGEWIVTVHELGRLEKWVRTTAVPTLITGHGQMPALRPHLDITTGHVDLRQAAAAAGSTPAAERATLRIASTMARHDLVDLISRCPGSPDQRALEAWTESLADHEVVERITGFQAAAPMVTLVTLVAEALAHASR
ncbi:hypothetical protein ACFXA3_29525 [Streptomyces sp. NPDC059456]|uniref:hypothetical protein n=1 Tax=Streptomyces sp. NPDC059456 TaxID=3346838 RepID=UPI003696585A